MTRTIDNLTAQQAREILDHVYDAQPDASFVEGGHAVHGSVVTARFVDDRVEISAGALSTPSGLNQYLPEEYRESPTLEDFVALRKSLGLSRPEVSRRLYLHPNYIAKLERGDVTWHPKWYFALLGLSK